MAMVRLTLKDGTKVTVTEEQSERYYRDQGNYVTGFQWINRTRDQVLANPERWVKNTEEPVYLDRAMTEADRERANAKTFGKRIAEALRSSRIVRSV